MKTNLSFSSVAPFVVMVFSLVSIRAHGADDSKTASDLKSVSGLKQVAECKTKSDHPLLIIKQWHYAPAVKTKPTAGALPQDPNQREIFDFLKEKISSGKIKTVIAEGCTGEINEKFTTPFNGWDYAALDEARQLKQLDAAQTMVPLKIEVLLKDKVLTMCGDDPELIKKQLLKLSDVRGTAGFLGRLEQYKDDAKNRESYLKSAVEVFKLDPKMKYADVLKILREKMKTSLRESVAMIAERNAKFVETIQANENKGPIAVVIGGMHAPDLVERLSKLQIGCSVLQPASYVTDEEDFMKKLESFK